MKLSAQSRDLSVDACAAMVMETTTLLMRAIRREMRRQRPAELSMSQFRALRILRRHPDLSLSHLAARLDLTLASASKLIDVLEKHGLTARDASLTDRRKVALRVTAHGGHILAAAERAAHANLAEMLTTLSADDRAAVAQAMRALHATLDDGAEGA